jgi:excisionase family DNA binding protein
MTGFHEDVNLELQGESVVRKSSSPMPVPLTTPLLTVEDAAQLLKVSRSKMYELIRNGLPTIKIGGQRRVLPSALTAWVETQAEDEGRTLPARHTKKARGKRGSTNA